MTSTIAGAGQVGRRGFLRRAGLALGLPALGGLLAACGGPRLMPGPDTGAASLGHGHGGVSPGGSAGAMSVDEMDRLHEEGVQAFLAGTRTAIEGGQPLEPRVEGGVKVFDLTAGPVQWEVSPGTVVPALAYNGQVPGPELRVTEGDRVRINFTNALEESSAIHWHGVLVPNAMDGVTYITQPPVKPGGRFTYEFVARNPGTHMYHAHHNSTHQVGKGLLGAFIIEPRDRAGEPTYDLDRTMVLNDDLGGYTLNGKSFPATRAIVANLGQRLRLRYIAQGQMIHPMHLHGVPQRVVARDGYWLPQPYLVDTVTVAPGERWDVIVDCTEPGIWAFHCHVLSHAESAHGMTGLVSALIIEA